MQKFCYIFKRALVMLLTFAIILPVLVSTFIFGVSALEEEKKTAYMSSFGNSYSYNSNGYVSYSVMDDLIAKNFFDGNDSGSKKAVAILTSGALKTAWTNVNINIRLPDGEELIKLDGDTLTADEYDSSYKGLYWKPYSYTVNGKLYLFNGKNKVTIVDSKYDSVEVEYRLTLNNITGIQSILNLPKILFDEAVSQTAALEKINNYYSHMGEIQKIHFQGLAFMLTANGDINDPDTAELYNAINGITQNCFDGDSLKMYNLLTGYKEGGLAYYYRNNSQFHREIELLNNYLTVVVKHKGILESTLSGTEFVDKINKIDTIKIAIEALKRELKQVNSAINVYSSNLEKLTKALVLEGTIPNVQATTVYLSESFVKAADNMVSLNVQVQGEKVTVPIFPKDHILTRYDVNKIINAVENKMAKFNYSSKYYDCNYTRGVFTAFIGKNVTTLKSKKFEFNYLPKNFSIEIEGSEDAIINIENLEIMLPVSDSPEYRYEYLVFGQSISAKEYIFTSEEFDQIVNSGGYKITRTKINVQREEYITLIDNLNKAVVSDLIAFALTEKDGKYSVVMKMDASSPQAMMNEFMGIATEFINHSYVAFGDNPIIYPSESGMNISIQAVLNTILESGFSSEMLVKMINANGAINNMPMPGDVISNQEMSKAGALVAQTTLCLGNSPTELKCQLPMYITVSNVPASVVSVRNILANDFSNYFKFKCYDGKVHFDINLPKGTYLMYIPALISTDSLNIFSKNSINDQVAFEFLQNLIGPIISGDMSVKSIQKMLARFGYTADLNEYENAIRICKKLYYSFTFEQSDEGVFANIGIDSYIEKLNLGVLSDLVAEKGKGINIPISTSFANLDKVVGILSTAIIICSIIIVGGGISVALALVSIHRRNTFADSIPLVHYDINDDDISYDISDDNINDDMNT